MRNKIFILIIFIGILSSCSKNADYEQMSPSSTESQTYTWQENANTKERGYDSGSVIAYLDDEIGESEKKSSQSNQQIPGQPKEEVQTKIIKEGNIGISVKDFKTARTGLESLIKKYKAYIADENERKSRYDIQSTIVIRMPAEHFDSFLEEIGSIAKKVKYKRINAQDVTRQYVDIESRLKIKKEVRIKYESFLKNAKNVEEMLAIEKEVRLLTEEIEAKEAELRYLSDRVGRSTITLDMSQKLKYQYEEGDTVRPSFVQRLGKGFSSGWSGVLSFFVGLTYLWPVILLGIILFLALRKSTGRFLKRLFGNK